MKDELSCRRAGFNLFGQRLQIDTARPKVGCELYEITETSTKSVQSPNNQSVTFTQRFQTSLKFRSNSRLAASVFLVDLSALRTLESVPLQIECLIIGRDASVANAHVANPKTGVVYGSYILRWLPQQILS